LIPQLSVNLGYTRRGFGNFTVTDNLDLVPADHDEFCITAPTDARLGGVRLDASHPDVSCFGS
jgi:hypothetical protein